MTCFSLLNLSLVMLSVSHCLAAAAAANNIIQLVVTNVATGKSLQLQRLLSGRLTLHTMPRF